MYPSNRAGGLAAGRSRRAGQNGRRNRLRDYLQRLYTFPAFLFSFVVFFGFLLLTHRAHSQGIPSEITVYASVNTSSVAGDADDPAIWIHPTDPAQSLLIGTDKTGNFVYVWDMNGQQRQRLSVVSYPNNGDVRSGMIVGGEPVDIYVVGSEGPSRVVVFKIDPDTRTLTDITTAGGILTPQVKDPYGVCLYKRARDGAMFVFVDSNGGQEGVLNQYRLLDDGNGRVRGEFVRSFGGDVNGRHSESLVADDQLGYVYISEEDCCVHKFYADPDMGNNQLAAFAYGDGIDPDREGLAIYGCSDGTGYILLSSQGNKRIKVYRREGDPGNPHSHTLVTTIYTPQISDTDGIDVTNRPAGPNFPFGFLAKHNANARSFALIAWEDIAQTYLTICPENEPPCDVSADFTANMTSGCAPLLVDFTDLSTGPVTSWSWNFGDGNTSTAQNPAHEYSAPGSYAVTLTASSESCSAEETRTSYITVEDAPTAAFIGSPVSGNAPLTVNFTDQSSGSPTSWSWDFGDGGQSTQQNPSHTYTTAGDYTVTLTATNACDADVAVMTGYIHVDPCVSPTAAFAGSPTTGNAPLTVNFTDQSSGSPISWSWDFGDGGQSTQQNPSHQYTTTGTFTVSLTVSNTCGSDSETKTNYLSVTAPPTNQPPVPTITSPSPGASLPAGQPISYAGDATDFEDGIEPASRFTWRVSGPGIPSGYVLATGVKSGTSPVPPSTGTYTITLEVTDSQGLLGSTAVTFTVGGTVTIPTAPSNLVATAAGASQINLTWTDNANNETGFRIERKTGSGGTYNQIATVAANVTSYANTGLAANTTYYYRVRAYNGAGNSGYSNEANATTESVTNTPPVATMTQPANGATFAVGQTVNFTGDATDTQDGVVAASGFVWRVITPVGTTVTLVSGAKSGFGVPTIAGSYTLIMEVTDSGGLTDTDQVTITATSGGFARTTGTGWLAPGTLTGEVVPGGYAFSETYPNPFNPVTHISFTLPQREVVTLRIYNAMGQEVRTLVVGVAHRAGTHRYRWDGRDNNGYSVTTGTYHARIDAGPLRASRKLQLVK